MVYCWSGDLDVATCIVYCNEFLLSYVYTWSKEQKLVHQLTHIKTNKVWCLLRFPLFSSIWNWYRLFLNHSGNLCKPYTMYSMALRTVINSRIYYLWDVQYTVHRKINMLISKRLKHLLKQIHHSQNIYTIHSYEESYSSKSRIFTGFSINLSSRIFCTSLAFLAIISSFLVTASSTKSGSSSTSSVISTLTSLTFDCGNRIQRTKWAHVC